MNRNRILKNAALGAGFAAVLASPVALHAMVTPPPPKPVVQAAKSTSADSFLATCLAAGVVDTRIDPAWVGASFDGDNCWAPKPPATFDGTDASRDRIVAAMATEKIYKGKVGTYQRCIANAVASRRTAADKTGKPMDVAFVTIESHRITAGEDNKKKADQRLAAEIEAFNEPGSECGPDAT